jgi:hypothetical protein
VSNPDETNFPVTKSLVSGVGIVFIAAECIPSLDPLFPHDGCSIAPSDSRVLSQNMLLASFSVIDMAGGFAYSAQATHIPGVPDASPGAFPFGDRLIEFTGAAGEFAQFSNVLTAQILLPDDDVTSHVIIATLDARMGNPASAISYTTFFDDDGQDTTSFIGFENMAVFDLETAIPCGGSFPCGGFSTYIRRDADARVGHLRISPQTFPRSGPDLHESTSPTGDNDGMRRSPVFGWVMSTVDLPSGVLFGGEVGGTLSGGAGWAVPLSRGTSAMPPHGSDIPSLDLR